ncbi:MAG: AAA family ATPase [Chitinophagales bacterium]
MENLPIHQFDQAILNNNGLYVSGMRLFLAHFKEIPCIIQLKGFKGNRIKEYLEAAHQQDILCCYKKQQLDRSEKKIGSINHIYCMKDNVLIDLEADELSVLYASNKEAEALRWVDTVRKIRGQRKLKTASNISLIRQTNYGLLTSEVPLKKPKLDLIHYYNDDILPMHEVVIKSLRQKDKSGIILLHGMPGTGKSTYIRYLVHKQKKKVIFLPAKMASVMESPHFTDFLISNTNSIFVIEDAEQLIISRESNYNSNISMLLNMTDGLLGESLGIQVIATFNTHIRNIDKALLRKGRLIALYEFKPLCLEKARALAIKMGIETSVTQPITLAEIYNTQPTEFSSSNARDRIGFASCVN